MRLLLALLLVGLSSCSKEKSAPVAQASSAGPEAALPTAQAQPTPASAAEDTKAMIERTGFCELTVDGALKGTGKVPGGKFTVGSDYFLSEPELQVAEKALGGKPGEKHDPRGYIFILNCKNDVLEVGLGPGHRTKYADMPFKPGKYAMGMEKGQVSALVNSRGADKKFFTVSSGSFQFTKWDKDGMAGSFSFDASTSTTGERIKVTGTFDLKKP